MESTSHAVTNLSKYPAWIVPIDENCITIGLDNGFNVVDVDDPTIDDDDDDDEDRKSTRLNSSH